MLYISHFRDPKNSVICKVTLIQMSLCCQLSRWKLSFFSFMCDTFCIVSRWTCICNTWYTAIFCNAAIMHFIWYDHQTIDHGISWLIRFKHVCETDCLPVALQGRFGKIFFQFGHSVALNSICWLAVFDVTFEGLIDQQSVTEDSTRQSFFWACIIHEVPINVKWTFLHNSKTKAEKSGKHSSTIKIESKQ